MGALNIPQLGPCCRASQTRLAFWILFAILAFAGKSTAQVSFVPDPPRLISPANGAVDQQTTLPLVWTASSGALTYYRLQLSADSLFSGAVIDDSTLSDTSHQVGPLARGSTFYWRVNARNLLGASDWSSVWKFSTVPAPPPSPTLVSPVDSAADQPTVLSLIWNVATRASTYRLQVSFSPSFSSILLDDSTLTEALRPVGPLANNSTYHWRVSAKNAGGSSEWSTIWTFTTVPSPPDPPVLSSPPDRAIDQSTTVTLSWNGAVGAASYRVQVSKDSSFAAMVVDDLSISITSKTLETLENGTMYHWRVNARNSGGTSGWSSAWSFTTVPRAPTAPVLVSPSNKVGDQPTILTLIWNPSAAASIYQLQVSADSSFATVLLDDANLTSISRQVGPLAHATTYHWRVRARNSGGMSSWSTTWSFLTAPPPPAAPSLIAPSNGSTDQPVAPTLSWGASTGAARYHLQLSVTSSFSTTELNDSTITTTSLQLDTLQHNTTYNWRVRAGNTGGWGAFSTGWNFTTKAANAPVATTQPPENITSTSATLRGIVFPNGLSTNAKFQYGTTAAYGNSVTAEQSPVSGSDPVLVTNTLRGLRPNTTYHYRHNAFNSAGTSLGEDVAFTTKYAVEAPLLVFPPYGAIDQSTTPTLTWKPPFGASAYHVQVSSDSTFSMLAVDDTTVTDTLLQVGPLVRNTTYFWRVQARNNLGSSPWSTTWRFMTLPPPPAAPLLWSPSNGVFEQPTTVTVTWKSAIGASTYRVQVSTGSSFTSTVHDQSSITSTSYTVGGLANNTTYFWRVNARNVGGTSEWSSVWRFTTNVPPPSAPLLVAPSDGSVAQPVSLTMSWESTAIQPTFWLQVSTVSSFVSLAIDDSTLVTTSREIGPVEHGKQYYWRVRVKNSGGISPWSSVWTFRTIGVLVKHGIVLTKGWNMISSFARPPVANLDTLCADIRDRLVIMKNGSGEVYWPRFAINGIGSWSYVHGYQLYMESADTLVIDGNEILPDFAPIGLNQGWNMTAYLRNGDLTVDSALADISNELVIVKNSAGEVYWPAFGINSIGSMRPGLGYQIYIKQAGTLTYPPNDSQSPSSTLTHPSTVATGIKGLPRPTHYHPIIATTGASATLLLEVPDLRDGDEVAVCGQDSRVLSSALVQNGRAVLTVWGDDGVSQESAGGALEGEILTLVSCTVAHGRERVLSVESLMNGLTAQRSGLPFRFVRNGVWVARANIVREIPSIFELLQNYPNPFNPSTVIRYGLPNDSPVRVEVYNVVGERIALLVDGMQRAGYHEVVFGDPSIATGVYFYLLEAGRFVTVRKMVLLR